MKALVTGLVILWATVAHAEAGFVLVRDAVSPGGGGVSAGDIWLGLTVGETVVGASFAADWAATGGFWAMLKPALLVDVPGDTGEGALRGVLYPGTPNPSSGRITIRFVVPAAVGGGTRVTLKVFDISGRLVQVLEDGPRPPGAHVAIWDGRSRSGARVNAGVYVCQLQAGGFVASRRLVVIR